MVSFCPLKISLPNSCTVLIFFIAGLFFLVPRARRNIGSVSHPVETGLLIPSAKRRIVVANSHIVARDHHASKRTVYDAPQTKKKAAESRGLSGPLGMAFF